MTKTTVKKIKGFAKSEEKSITIGRVTITRNIYGKFDLVLNFEDLGEGKERYSDMTEEQIIKMATGE